VQVSEYMICTYCAPLVSCSFVFFFSSRRRHTRLVSDWSSDVCSSDLGASWFNQMYRLSADMIKPGCSLRDLLQRRKAVGTFDGRSEERRVGKEWRYRVWGDQ